MAVVIIDAGYADFGDTLADIEEHYGISHADLVISTHPDGDHFNGLPRLLERACASELMIHCPDLHGHDEGEVCADKVAELVTLAEKRGITVTEPFWARRCGGRPLGCVALQLFRSDPRVSMRAELSRARGRGRGFLGSWVHGRRRQRL